MRPDLHAIRQAIASGATDARTELERSIELARSPACRHVFLRDSHDRARRALNSFVNTGSAFAGLAFSAKDLFDLEDEPTPAGSIVLANAPPARIDAPAVARLKQAGGVLIGRTNMSEFAFSGVGTNPHYGTPVNPADTTVERIPGGSSSGAAVSVATGAAFVGLGSDTGGSIRIPAALCGIVGFKSTARRVPTEGALPLSTTLDTVCAMTRSVRDAILAHEVLSDRRVDQKSDDLASKRFAVIENYFFNGAEPVVARSVERSIDALSKAGAKIERIQLPLIDESRTLNATGGFSAPEAYAWHRLLLERSAAGYDPRVARRILKGAEMRAHEYIDLMRGRLDWIARMKSALASYDAVLSPTVPIVAPPIALLAPGESRDDEFFRINALLLRNPSAINLVDGCAISLPCQLPDELPVGLMLWHTAMHDDALLATALQVEAALARV